MVASAAIEDLLREHFLVRVRELRGIEELWVRDGLG